MFWKLQKRLRSPDKSSSPRSASTGNDVFSIVFLLFAPAKSPRGIFSQNHNRLAQQMYRTLPCVSLLFLLSGNLVACFFPVFFCDTLLADGLIMIGEDWFAGPLHRLSGDGAGCHQFIRRNGVHQIHDDRFHDGTKSSGSRLSRDSPLGNGSQRILREDQLHTVPAQKASDTV